MSKFKTGDKVRCTDVDLGVGTVLDTYRTTLTVRYEPPVNHGAATYRFYRQAEVVPE